ncbi:MAG TPA: HD domain-containing protein [Urbifossiella sp.]|nr:HD domain-containing protein [Urbifossiella sp.]
MPKPVLVRLCELAPDQYADFYAQLTVKARSSTNTGKPYFACKFRDRSRTVAAVPIWSDSQHFEACQKTWLPGHFFKIRATYTQHEKFGPQIDIEQIRAIQESDREEGFTELDFVDRSRFDPAEMFSEMQAFATAEIKDEPLRALVLKLFEDRAEALKLLPATATKFYPFAGGWLEHTLSVAKNCAWLADRYIAVYPTMVPALNRDLVVAGALLHDIGRVKEYEGSAAGAVPRPGIDGELFGHILLGRDLVRDAARELPDLNPELAKLLEHIVLTHLTRPEWGSPRLPCIPEVLIIHHADDLDAKFEMYARCLAKDDSDGPFTNRDPVLNRPLLKARSV